MSEFTEQVKKKKKVTSFSQSEVSSYPAEKLYLTKSSVTLSGILGYRYLVSLEAKPRPCGKRIEMVCVLVPNSSYFLRDRLEKASKKSRREFKKLTRFMRPAIASRGFKNQKHPSVRYENLQRVKYS